MDSVQIVRFCVALIFVLSLMWLLSLLMKRLGYGKFMPMKNEDRRLEMIEYLPLDTKNRLVLVRHDDVEHLLLVNAEGSTVVETGNKIKKTAPKANKPSKKKKAA